MATIEIRNIGPIKEANFDLNKVIVFMGTQGSGKSTIAKICSQCLWYEKNYILTGDEYDFYEGLITFHRMDENYFSDDSEIEYKSQWVTINLKNKKTTVERKDNKEEIYRNLKIEYIPAERNFVAAIPNLQKYSDNWDNIINFLNDWLLFKGVLTKDEKYSSPLKSVDVEYEYNLKTKEDILTLSNTKTILLQRSSSGQQSIIPLLVVCKYLFDDLYNRERIPSSAEKKYIQDLLPENMKEDYNWVIKMQNHQQYVKPPLKETEIEDVKNIIWKKIGFSTDYTFSNVIIEEPEQNLFPETQKELVYHLLKSIQQKERHHSLLITTHSPYILYALNNCMMGGLVYDKMSDKDKQRLKCQSSFINPQDVSVYEIHDGILIKMQQDDNLIGANYFDKKMKELMDDFYVMLNYYE